MGPILQRQVRPFRASDVAAIAPRLQPAQNDMLYYFSLPGYAEQLEKDESFTLEADGVVIASAGVSVIWENRAFAWALLTEDASRHMVALTRAVKRFLSWTPIRRVEAYVDPGFTAGIRWIELLGFRNEGRLEAFSPEGYASLMYARIKGDTWQQHPSS